MELLRSTLQSLFARLFDGWLECMHIVGRNVRQRQREQSNELRGGELLTVTLALFQALLLAVLMHVQS